MWMRRWGLGRRPATASGALARMPRDVGDWSGDASGLAVVRDG